MHGSDPNGASRLLPKLAHSDEFGLDLFNPGSRHRTGTSSLVPAGVVGWARWRLLGWLVGLLGGLE
jgi:hypothetical protein